MKIPILTYHKVDTKFEVGITRVSPKKFEEHIKFLYENGFKGITVSEALTQRQSSEKFIAITFDDGYKNIFEFAFPILKKYGFKATAFVITNYVGRTNDWDFGFGIKFPHMSWEELKILLDNGWEIGSHSANHIALTLLDDEKVKYELESSKFEIEKNLGTSVKSFAPPFSRFDERIIKTALELGYDAIYALTNGISHPKVHHRFAVYTTDGIQSIKRKLAGLSLEKFKLNLINSFSSFTLGINYLKNKNYFSK